MQVNLLIGVLICTFGLTLAQQQNLTATRDGKALSVFQVVRFPNTACSGTSSLNGTCYTTSECTNKGGTSAGSCANGFGVCCTFTLGCGRKISENCTYFQSSTTPATGACGVTICKCSSDICKLRMDFNSFVITGPNTLTASALYNLQGNVVAKPGLAVGQPASLATNCLTDTFTVTGSGGTKPPVICGTNTGYHMFVDASDQCNQLNFQLGNNGMGTAIAARSWNIKVSQISCLDANLAPDSCTQYFTGVTGTLNSYNWAGSHQLANQQQTICVRRARGYCKICYSPTTITDFQVSGKNTLGYHGMGCCNYGSVPAASPATSVEKAWDCLQIPGAKKTNGISVLNNFCGARLITTAMPAAMAMINKTICSNQQPYMIQFQTDSFTASIAIVALKGFNLIYWQSTTC